MLYSGHQVWKSGATALSPAQHDRIHGRALIGVATPPPTMTMDVTSTFNKKTPGGGGRRVEEILGYCWTETEFHADQPVKKVWSHDLSALC